MQCQFIASRNAGGRSIKLFRMGDYQYEICELRNGSLKRVRLLTNMGLEQAMQIFQEIQ